MQPETTTCIPRNIALQAAMFSLGNIEEEIQGGYEILKNHHKTITIFGSARTPQDSPYYKAASDIAGKLASQGFTIVTGGGFGIMSAGNEGPQVAALRGAKEAEGKSVAFNIQLPKEQSLNGHASESYEFRHFAPRKIVMTLFANAYLFFPGGFGTLDELMEILTLIQTQKTNPAPVILYGQDFWRDLDNFIRNSLLEKEKTISQGDELLYTITDDIDEVVRLATSNRTYCDH